MKALLRLSGHALERFAKARAGLVPHRRAVNRGGKTHIQTFWVNPLISEHKHVPERFRGELLALAKRLRAGFMLEDANRAIERYNKQHRTRLEPISEAEWRRAGGYVMPASLKERLAGGKAGPQGAQAEQAEQGNLFDFDYSTPEPEQGGLFGPQPEPEPTPEPPAPQPEPAPKPQPEPEPEARSLEELENPPPGGVVVHRGEHTTPLGAKITTVSRLVRPEEVPEEHRASGYYPLYVRRQHVKVHPAMPEAEPQRWEEYVEARSPLAALEDAPNGRTSGQDPLEGYTGHALEVMRRWDALTRWADAAAQESHAAAAALTRLREAGNEELQAANERYNKRLKALFRKDQEPDEAKLEAARRERDEETGRIMALYKPSVEQAREAAHRLALRAQAASDRLRDIRLGKRPLEDVGDFVEAVVEQAGEKPVGPRVGDRKTVNGVTYRLNENHRWERVEEPQPESPAPDPESPAPDPEPPAPQPEPAPASAEGVKPAPRTPPQPEYRDVGEKIGMARKDIAALRAELDREARRALTAGDLEGLEREPGLAARYVTRDRQLGKAADLAQDMKDIGASPGAAYLATRLLSSVAPKPDDTPAARARYVRAARMLREAMLRWQNPQDALRGIKELQEIGRGYSYTAEELAELQRLKAQRDEINRERARRLNELPRTTPYAEYVRAASSLDAELAPRLQPILDAIYALERQAVTRNEADPDSPRNLLAALGEKFLEAIGVRYKKGWADRWEEAAKKAAAFDQAGDWGFALKAAPAGGEGQPQAAARRRRIPPFERRGEDVRKGHEVRFNSEELHRTFNLRGVEYGNWMSQEDAALHTQKAGEALYDLARLLHIPIEQVSWNGRLALGFGARGKGAVAHYEPVRKVINLTKYAGGGSLAHEWGHFLDNVMAMLSTGGQSHHTSYVSDNGWSPPGDGLPPEVAAAWEELGRAINQGSYRKAKTARPATHYYRADKRRLDSGESLEALIREKVDEAAKRLKEIEERGGSYAGMGAKAVLDNLDRDMRYLAAAAGRPIRYTPPGGEGMSHFRATAKLMGDYWSRPHELFARAFEAWVHDRLAERGWVNTYLVKGVDEEAVRRWGREAGLLEEEGGVTSLYPLGEERKRTNAAFDRLLYALAGSGALAKALGLWGSGAPGRAASDPPAPTA